MTALTLPCARAAGGESGDPLRAVPETQLVNAMAQWQAGHYDTARDELRTLIGEQPDFRLANFLYGEMLQARTGRPLKVSLDKQARAERSKLVDEARLRWRHRLQEPPANAVPNAILKLAPEYHYAIVVDLLRNRLYLMRNVEGRPELVADFYASIGEAGAGKQVEGDAKTPVGVYHVTQYKPDSALPELYGAGAFPVNYPNNLDRLFGRTGDGIWVHGVPRTTYNRAPRASLGCVAISNSDLTTLKHYIRPGITPVVFTNQLHWLTAGEADKQRRALLARVQAWRKAWERLDTPRYLGFYASDFISGSGLGKQEFAAYKREVNASKQKVKIHLSDISVFRYPASADMALITFTQRYSSKNFNAISRKQQFWREDDGRWQIMHEDSVAASPAEVAAGE